MLIYTRHTQAHTSNAQALQAAHERTQNELIAQFDFLSALMRKRSASESDTLKNFNALKECALKLDNYSVAAAIVKRISVYKHVVKALNNFYNVAINPAPEPDPTPEPAPAPEPAPEPEPEPALKKFIEVEYFEKVKNFEGSKILTVKNKVTKKISINNINLSNWTKKYLKINSFKNDFNNIINYLIKNGINLNKNLYNKKYDLSNNQIGKEIIINKFGDIDYYRVEVIFNKFNNMINILICNYDYNKLYDELKEIEKIEEQKNEIEQHLNNFTIVTTTTTKKKNKL